MFYIVSVCSGRKKWKLDKRYNEFNDLDKVMRLKHANMPNMPPKTYFPLKLDQDIEQRRIHLHNYLTEIVNRPDMRTSPQFRKWLEIDTYI